MEALEPVTETATFENFGTGLPRAEVFVESTRTHKSFHYRTKTTWSSARRGVLSAAGKPNIIVGSPPEFRGEANHWAPEELLVSSLNTCTMLTFMTLAQPRGVTLVGYESEAEGLLEHVDGVYQLTAVTMRPRVTIDNEAGLASARNAMDEVEARCFIANSIKAKVTLLPEFIVATGHS